MSDIPFTFSHVTRDDEERKLHLSHLMRYVSAYQISDYMVGQLCGALIEGLKKAKETSSRQIVDQDGEMFFVCNPCGTFTLCVPWKTYKPYPPDEDDEAYFNEDFLEGAAEGSGDDTEVILAPNIPPPPPPSFPRNNTPKDVLAPPPRKSLDPIHGPYCDCLEEKGFDAQGEPIVVFCGLLKDHDGPCNFARSVFVTNIRSPLDKT